MQGKVTITDNPSHTDVVTHSGPAHADDAMAVAIIAMSGVIGQVGQELQVARTRDSEFWTACNDNEGVLFVDVGGRFDPQACQYDHHQRDFEQSREDGVKYSSAGLIWDFAPHQYIARWAVKEACASGGLAVTEMQVDQIVTEVGRVLIEAIDAIDSGQRAKVAKDQEVVPPLYTISSLVHQMNPVETDDPTAFDAAFLTQVEICSIALQASIRQAAAKVRSEKRVREAIDKAEDGVVIFDRYEAAASSILPEAPENVLFQVFPSEGKWMVQQLPVTPGSFDGRKSLPKEWAGKRAEAGDTIDGLDSFVFVHNAAFIGGCVDKADAIKMAKYAVTA